MPHMTAVRALNRLLRPHAMVMEKVMSADAGFDAGEWSTGAHERRWFQFMDAQTAMVAERFGMTVAELETAMMESEYRSCNYGRG